MKNNAGFLKFMLNKRDKDVIIIHGKLNHTDEGQSKN